VKARENGRDELAFPAPVEESVHSEWESPQAHVTGFLREGRSSLRQNDQETRRRAASARDAIKQVVRAGKTGREAESRPPFRGFGAGGEHSPVKTGSCYCEPVWWSAIQRFWTIRIEAAASFRCRNRRGKRDTGRRGLSDPRGRRRTTGGDHGDVIRSEQREAPKTGSSD